MKKILLLCLTALLSISIWASDSVLCLTITTTDGDEVYFGLHENPIITYGDMNITITSTTYSIEDMSLNELEMYYFSYATPTGIGTISTMGDATTEFADGKAFITGLRDGAQVYVYTSDGQIVGSVLASQDGNVCIDLGSLKGNQVYILRTPSTSYKIVK